MPGHHWRSVKSSGFFVWRANAAWIFGILIGALLAGGTCTASAVAERASSDLFPEQAASIAMGQQFSCALDIRGEVRCWGRNDYGQLGYGNTESIGDTELPGDAGPVDLGGKAAAIAAGDSHVCALLESGSVRCWGQGAFGKLGYGNSQNVGDNESPSSAGPVSLGGPAAAIAAGGDHSCAVLIDGVVRCWGRGMDGRLGYGNPVSIGDDEFPSSVSPVDLGGKAKDVVAGAFHTCALLEDGLVRCWGEGGSGQLGNAETAWIGDNETPASIDPVGLGGQAIALAAGGVRTCAILTDGAVRCWGWGKYGALGYGNEDDIGDNESPSQVPPLQLGAKAIGVAVGGSHACAVLVDGAVRCWGNSSGGELGYGATEAIGDDETPDSVGPVELGGAASAIALGSGHSCASLETGGLRCWGLGASGALGYGGTSSVGDDESPASAGDVHLGGALHKVEGDLSLDEEVTPSAQMIGDRLTLTLKVNNQGPEGQAGISVHVGIPPGFSVVDSATSFGEFNGAIWDIPWIKASGRDELTLRLVALNSGTFAIPAEIIAATYRDPDSTPSDGSSNEDDSDAVSIQLIQPKSSESVSLSPTTPLLDTRAYGLVVKGHWVTVRFFANQPIQGFVCRLDDRPARPCSSPASFRVVRGGVHRLRIAAIDLAGHRDPFPATRYFRIRGKPPIHR